MRFEFIFVLIFSTTTFVNSQETTRPCTCVDRNNWFWDWILGDECVCQEDLETPENQKAPDDQHDQVNYQSGDEPIVITEEDENLLASFLASVGENITFSSEAEKFKAIQNVKVASATVNELNDLHNQGLSSYEAQVYSFMRFSPEEIERKMFGATEKPVIKRSILPLQSVNGTWETPDGDATWEYRRKKRSANLLGSPICQNLPEYFNWVERGKLPPIKDQGQCGCCFIFAGTTVLESRVAIAYNTTVRRLSEQNCLECIKVWKGSNGCNGGRAEYIWQEATKSGGIAQESAYLPYNANQDGPCMTEVPRDSRAQVDFFSYLSSENEEEMMCQIVNYGPIAIAMDVTAPFYAYKSGIFDDPTKTCRPRMFNHAMVLVGYGTETTATGEKIDYWIIQNTWGVTWGEKGFMRARRGVGLCSINIDVTFPIIKTSKPNILNPIETPKSCQVQGDIYDANGKYVKSFCIDVFSRLYEESRVSCLRRGMQLFRADSDAARKGIFNASEEKWTKNWWTNDIHIERESSGHLYLTNKDPFGPFRTGPGNPLESRQCACEYIDVNLLQEDDTTTTTTRTTTRPLTTTLRTTTFTGSTRSTTTTTPPSTRTTTTRSTTSTTIRTTTTRPPTTTTRSPLVQRRPSICKNIRDLKNSDGNYVKTVCTVYLLYNQFSARDVCRTNGMLLYRFVFPEDETALLEYADTQWPANRLWVEGGNRTHGVMISNLNTEKFVKQDLPNLSTYNYFYCEYFNATANVNAILQPTELPSLCTWIRNIYVNKTYVKTICYVPLARTPPLAATHCANSKTSLLVLENMSVRRAVFEQLNRDLPSGWILWYDGRNSTTGGCNSMRKFTVFDSIPYPCTNTYYFLCEYKKPADNLP